MKQDQVVTRVNRDLFFKVASELEKERLQAAVQLVNEISDVETGGADESGRKEWEYVIGRLVKGLASNRGGARLGFSMCLTEIVALALERKEVFTGIDGFLDQLESTLAAGSAFKNGKEERGVLFGQMFALQCLMNEPVFSKVFLDGKDSGAELNVEFLLKFLEKLIQLALYKTWLREPCLYSVHQTIQKCAKQLFDDPEAIKLILGLLDENKLTLTNEGLSIYLMFNAQRDTFSKSLSLGNSGWKNNDPLSKGNVQLLASVLKDVVPVEKSDLKQKGSWAPRLHYVWDLLLPLLNGDDSTQASDDSHVSKKRKKNSTAASSGSVGKIQFPEFWQAVVDESFFNEKASNERKYLGFLILERAVKICSAQHVQVLLSQNLLRCIVNQSQDSQRMLNKISAQALKAIVAETGRTPAKVVPLVEVLWFGKNGNVNFDKLIKNKIVDSLISTPSMDQKNLVDLVTLLISQLPADQSTNENVNLTRFIFDTLLHVIRAHKTQIDSHFVKPVLSAMIKTAFFNESGNAKVSEVARERLYSVLGELLNAPVKADKKVSSWPYVALQIIFKTELSIPLSIELDEELESVRKAAVATLKEIHSSNKNNSNSTLKGLELLLSVAILQLYSGDEESVSILQDLISFYEQSGKDSTDLVGITEILLSLVAQRKSLLKKLSLLVWESCTQDVGEPELNVLLQTLTARENKQGFTALFEGDEEDEDDEEDEEDEEDDEDEEEEDPSDDESDDDDSKEEDDDALEKIEKETTSALAKALNLPASIVGEHGEVHLGDSDEDNEKDGHNDDDDDDDDVVSEVDESMDDEAMMELDGQLSEIFKRRKEALNSVPTGNKRKVEVQESRENVISFKHRVVDMLEIYVRSFDRAGNKNGASDVTPEDWRNLTSIILPVLKCLQQTLDKYLADKCAKLLKTRVSKVKATITEEDETVQSENQSLLKEVHKLILTSKPGQFQQLFFSTCSLASLFLCKSHLSNSGSYETLIDLYAETSKAWMKEGKFTVNFFIDFSNWLQTKRAPEHQSAQE
ncbi:unnamed protein product [Kluyveromyces dobzhanskii CBS 2104]|uniref:WGS project CCBQ000000000 data, contig 00098 n=1 Tax=Kluyveromyces dobzhanskii CBS 2104 TaxID=1427455 RepID=A0A0A8L5A0_9SACH|nr:unnamed protein product [Kluyveromyces dobzhanskii CBS 2104]